MLRTGIFSLVIALTGLISSVQADQSLELEKIMALLNIQKKCVIC